MNVQYDLFDERNEIGMKKRECQEKIEILATGKHLRGLDSKAKWEAHVRKMRELFGEEE